MDRGVGYLDDRGVSYIVDREVSYVVDRGVSNVVRYVVDRESSSGQRCSDSSVSDDDICYV